MDTINQIGKEMMRLDHPDFAPGDTVKVHVKIKEGDKERIQVFQGVVISRKNNQSNSTFTVRKVSYGVGVERIFLLHSPVIDKIEVTARGRVRRAKIYYLRMKRRILPGRSRTGEPPWAFNMRSASGTGESERYHRGTWRFPLPPMEPGQVSRRMHW